MYLIIAKWVGGIVGGLIIAWLGYALLIKPFTKPLPTTTNQAERINNYYNQPRISFGCARWEVVVDKKEDITTDADSVSAGVPVL
jgi:hypothetical protein